MSDTVIDSCCLMNMCAAGDLQSILPYTGLVWHVPPAVAGEAIFVRAVDGDGNLTKQQITLGPCFATKVLLDCPIQAGSETSLYVELAADLADGEAMALAIASSRGWLLATDDRKARRRAAGLRTAVISTPEIMRLWAATAPVDADGVRDALTRIQTMARFVPPPDFPEYDWWVASIRKTCEYL